MAAILFFVT